MADGQARGSTRWWWVRHAPVPDGGRIYGQSDLDCDCGNAVTFRALAQELPVGAVWVTSNLKRTHQTAAAIRAAAEGRHDVADPIAVPELAEQHLGDWQGLDRKTFYAERRIGSDRVWFAPAYERAPNGESYMDLVGRAHGAIERLSAQHAGRDIVAVTHGGTIRAALALALHITPEASLAFAIENCSLTRLDLVNGHWRIGAVNHRPWLGAPPAAPGPLA